MQNGSSGSKYTLRFLSFPYRLFPKKLPVSFCSLILAVFTTLPLSGKADTSGLATDDLLNFSLEQLANLKVTPVSKKPQNLSQTSASVYVITADDIRRGDAITIPEILWLAPNLQVARVGAANYAISARGFNKTTASKMQVLIDWRIAYTPLFSAGAER